MRSTAVKLSFDLGWETHVEERKGAFAEPAVEVGGSPGFPSGVLAGFECGFLGWNRHDLLVTTGHVPEGRMSAHYAAAKRHGLLAARDGLPWRHDRRPRLATAAATGVQVIWDLSHFDPPPDPIGHAHAVAVSADPATPLWLCAVNEPMLYPSLAGMPRPAAIEMALTMARVAKDHHPEVRIRGDMSVDESLSAAFLSVAESSSTKRLHQRSKR
jgi:hypothetical protein